MPEISPYDTYSSPLAARNASEAMLRLWSPRHKFNTWRRIWLAVAEAQYEVTKEWPKVKGKPPLVTQEQVEALRRVVERKNADGSIGITDDEMRLAEKYEGDLRHDVMAHVHTLGDACPEARGIIHLGCTSQDVVCNADMAVFREALALIETKVARAVLAFLHTSNFTRSMPTLGFTHYQPAQPTTVGRRVALWSHDLVLCLRRLGQNDHPSTGLLRQRGLRGATGTQASFVALLSEDAATVDSMELRAILSLEGRENELQQFHPNSIEAGFRQNCEYLERMANRAGQEYDWARSRLQHALARGSDGFAHDAREQLSRETAYSLTGQTYPRVVDTFILADLASIACVLHKIATDIRLLSNRKELDEPFESKQIGSSAMPYKRNPMRCERICGLTRFVMNLVGNAYDTAATQWLERTLDDSSNRRLSLPEAFLALDGALDLMHNVASGLIVHEAMVKRNLMAELPFMATENLLMACVRLGGDRQEYHEAIRVHAQAAGLRVKQEGLDNDLLDRLRGDRRFWSAARGGPLREELDWDGLLDPMKYIGRSVEQTERFIAEVIDPLRERYAREIAALDDSGPRV